MRHADAQRDGVKADDHERDPSPSSSTSELAIAIAEVCGFVDSSAPQVLEAARNLETGEVSPERVRMWLTHPEGWSALKPSNADRQRAWPSQVAVALKGWKTSYERQNAYIRRVMGID